MPLAGSTYWGAPAEEGAQPQLWALAPPPQVWGAVHVPHGSMPPQPSPIEPQSALAAAQVVLVQPQVLAEPPPPQLWGGLQLPQLGTVRGWPQLSVPLT